MVCSVWSFGEILSRPLRDGHSPRCTHQIHDFAVEEAERYPELALNKAHTPVVKEEEGCSELGLNKAHAPVLREAEGYFELGQNKAHTPVVQEVEAENAVLLQLH